MGFRIACFVLGALGCLTASLRASALRWQKAMIETVAKPDQREVQAEFEFRNASAQPITIRSVATSCGCTTAKLAKHTYAPGETGTIDVTFHVGSLQGTQHKTVYVRTDNSPESDPDELHLDVKIESYLSLVPSALIWSVDDPAAGRSIACQALLPTDLKLIDARSDNPALTVSAETRIPGRSYVIHVTPKSTAAPLDTKVRLKFALSDGTQREYVVPAIVLTPIRPGQADD